VTDSEPRPSRVEPVFERVGKRRKRPPLPPHRLPFEPPPGSTPYRYSEQTCPHCAQPFWGLSGIPWGPAVRGGGFRPCYSPTIYCSTACGSEARRVYRLAERQARTPVACAVCDKPLAEVTRRMSRIYCSLVCKQRAFRP
jgi:hypothetical protein